MYREIHTQSLLAIMISVVYLITLIMITMSLLAYGYATFYPHSIQQLEIIHYLFQSSYTGLLNVNYLTVAEKRHLFDVKYLIITWESYTYYSVFISSFFLFYLKNTLHFFKIVSYIGLGSIGLLLIMIALNDFIIVFHYMHTVFFHDNTWVFSQESRITQLFPINYFYLFSLIYLAILTFLLSSVLLWDNMK